MHSSSSVSCLEFASRIVEGNTLQDKLYAPVSLHYEQVNSHSAYTIAEPARPENLQFSAERLNFPKNFHEDKQRGIALHFFANHELLAIELMALCLLKFPDAPLAFRKGLVHIIGEEQEHLRLYIDRMQELGVHIGDVPVNRFFWDCLSGMSSPWDFVTGMSLTFEQANLDHCVHYGALFKDAQDEKTVGILEKVYTDELRHVRHGLHWFRQWKAENAKEVDFFVHEKSLQLPLSLMRAKGLTFDRVGREKIGFTQDYIERLSVFSLSKGRPANVYVFRPNCELDHSKQTPKKVAKIVEKALAPLMIFVAKKDDIVLCKPLPLEQQQALQRVGVVLPQQVEDIEEIRDRYLGDIRPWGLSENICAEFSLPWNPAYTTVFSKAWSGTLLAEFLQEQAQECLCPLDTVGVSLRDVDAVEKHIAQLATIGHNTWIIKGVYGTAGRSSIRGEGALLDTQRMWLQKQLRMHPVVVEPLLARVFDYSIQLVVHPDSVQCVSSGRFETDNQGQYLGQHLGAIHQGLSSDMLRFLHGNGANPRMFRQIIHDTAMFVGKKLQEKGCFGWAGIDALVYRSAEGYKIRPIVEINPRLTMGRIAHEVSAFVHPKKMSQAFFSIQPTSPELLAQAGMEIQDGAWYKGVQFLTDATYPMVAMVKIG